MLNLILFGPPGSGKGTQAAKLLEKYQLVHLSTGDIFRANLKGETELGVLAKTYIDQGNLVPDDVTIRMLEAEVDKHFGANGFIFDGFLRTALQASALDEFLTGKQTAIHVALLLEVSDEEVKVRIAGRAIKENRPDDANPEVIANRLKVYHESTKPVLPYYEEQGKLHRVEGIGEIGAIFNQLCSSIEAVQS